LQASADWGPVERPDEPLIYAGLGLRAPDGQLPPAFRDGNSYMNMALRAADLEIGMHRNQRHAWCGATLYLSDLGARAATLDQQLERATSWICDVFDRIGRIQPPNIL